MIIFITHLIPNKIVKVYSFEYNDISDVLDATCTMVQGHFLIMIKSRFAQECVVTMSFGNSCSILNHDGRSRGVCRTGAKVGGVGDPWDKIPGTRDRLK